MAMAKLGGRNTNAKAFVEASGGVTPAGITKSLKRMEDLKIVYAAPAGYKSTDAFFGHWLLSREIISLSGC